MALGEYEDAIDTTRTSYVRRVAAFTRPLDQPIVSIAPKLCRYVTCKGTVMPHTCKGQVSGSSPLVYHGGLRRGAADRDLWCGPDSAR
jgi:hypothetical protein